MKYFVAWLIFTAIALAWNYGAHRFDEEDWE